MSSTHPGILHLNYNRPDKTSLSIQPLIDYPGPLFLFADGPQSPNDPPTSLIDVRNILTAARTYRLRKGLPTELNFLPENHGPARAPLIAQQWFFFFTLEGHIIEDDILVHPSFFAFHRALLEQYRHSDIFCIGAGHPLPESPWRCIKTHTTQLVAWSTWKNKHQALNTANTTPTPWKRHGLKLLKGLAPKTQIFLWKEFRKLEANPNWSWAYLTLQKHLEHKFLSLTPTARLHSNIGLDGSGHNCLNFFNKTEDWNQAEVESLLKRQQDSENQQLERQIEWERYGRITQAIARLIYHHTPSTLNSAIISLLRPTIPQIRHTPPFFGK